MSYTSLSKAELIKLKNSIENSISNLKLRITKLDENLISVKGAIKHLDKEKNQSIIIPSKLLYTSVDNTTKQKYEWKNKVERSVKGEDNLITCREIFDKLKMEDDWPLINDRDAIKNISAALIYLIRDGKIKKIKPKNKGIFLYGNPFLHFDINGKIKNRSNEKFLSGNKIMTI